MSTKIEQGSRSQALPGIYAKWPIKSQLTLRPNNLQQATSIAQNNLTLIILRDKANLLKSILHIPHTPDLSGKLITRSHRRGKTSLELLQVSRVATTQLAQDAVRSRVPAEQAVDDDSAESHLLAWSGGGVQRVIVAV